MTCAARPAAAASGDGWSRLLDSLRCGCCRLAPVERGAWARLRAAAGLEHCCCCCRRLTGLELRCSRRLLLLPCTNPRPVSVLGVVCVGVCGGGQHALTLRGTARVVRRPRRLRRCRGVQWRAAQDCGGRQSQSTAVQHSSEKIDQFTHRLQCSTHDSGKGKGKV